jgi:hypothetical protein
MPAHLSYCWHIIPLISLLTLRPSLCCPRCLKCCPMQSFSVKPLRPYMYIGCPHSSDAMGSEFPFGLIECPECRVPSPRAGGTLNMTYCVVVGHGTCRACRCTRLRDRMENDLLPRQIRGIDLGALIVHYFIPNDLQVFEEKIHNWVFRGRASPLRRFTYYHNGDAGCSLRQNKEILDLILEYNQ